MEQSSRFDVLIVGGGVMGLASAYFLATRGAKVAVLDRGPLAQEASALNFGGVRQSNRDPRELPLAMLAADLWLTLDERLERPTGYRRTGNLRVALDDQDLEALRASARVQQQGGLDVRLLDADEARREVPRLADAVLGATYCPSDGQAEPRRTIAAWQTAAERMGVTLCPGREVLSIRVDGARVAGVETDSGGLDAAFVVNSAGPWAPSVGRMVGVYHAIAPWLAEVLTFEQADTWLDTVLSWGSLSFRQSAEGDLWAGISSRPYGRFERGDATAEAQQLLVSTGRRVLEGTPFAPVARSWNGITEWTPDGIAILDNRCGPQGYLVAAGFCGHGFALSPAVGLLVSELILDGTTQLSLDAFRNGRFAE